MRGLENRLTAKDISGFITMERYDQKQRKASDNQGELPERQPAGYPQDAIGNY
jgi:hypothetical protein